MSDTINSVIVKVMVYVFVRIVVSIMSSLEHTDNIYCFRVLFTPTPLKGVHLGNVSPVHLTPFFLV